MPTVKIIYTYEIITTVNTNSNQNCHEIPVNKKRLQFQNKTLPNPNFFHKFNFKLNKINADANIEMSNAYIPVKLGDTKDYENKRQLFVLNWCGFQASQSLGITLISKSKNPVS
jgi:hypothetical protein